MCVCIYIYIFIYISFWIAYVRFIQCFHYEVMTWKRSLHYWPSHLEIESILTTSIETVSKGALEMNNIIYEVKIKPKMIWRIKTYTIAYVKKTKTKCRYIIHYVQGVGPIVTSVIHNALIQLHSFMWIKYVSTIPRRTILQSLSSLWQSII